MQKYKKYLKYSYDSQSMFMQSVSSNQDLFFFSFVKMNCFLSSRFLFLFYIASKNKIEKKTKNSLLV